MLEVIATAKSDLGYILQKIRTSSRTIPNTRYQFKWYNHRLLGRLQGSTPT